MNQIKSLFIALLIIVALCVPTNTVLAQLAFNVHVDTLFAEGNKVVFDGYSFRLYNSRWCFSMSKPDPTVLYEDDLYTVNVDDYDNILFTEKQPSLYIDAHKGWLQHEYVNRQYYFTGKMRQILRHGDYYYFVNSKQVDSMRIDQSPGNPLVKNTLSDIWDGYFMTNNAKWCDPISGFGQPYSSHCRGCGWGYYNSAKPIDTTYCGAFVANNQVYFLLVYDQEIFIARRQGDKMTKVLDLGQGWSFDGRYDGRYNWWTFGPGDNRLLKPFHAADGTTGLLTIDDSDIRIQYVMSPKTLVP